MKITNTEVKNIEPIKTFAVHHVGEYSGISGAFEKLGQWAAKNNYWVNAPRMAGIYHDNPDQVPAEKLRSSACLEDMGGIEPGPEMERYEIGGGKYFIMTVEVTMDEFYDAWNKAYDAVAQQGLACDMRDHYELYIRSVDGSQREDAPWIVEFRVPVK